LVRFIKSRTTKTWEKYINLIFVIIILLLTYTGCHKNVSVKVLGSGKGQEIQIWLNYSKIAPFGFIDII